MKKAWLIGFVFISFFLGTVWDACAQKRKPLMIEGKNVLKLRVLVRPFSNIYKEADADSSVVKENLPAFQPFYVYTRPTPSDLGGQDQWYEVGSDNRGTVLGWMKADDVMEWKQAMCLAYTHPEGRNPVLMFEKKKDLKKLLEMEREERSGQSKKLYDTIKSGSIPKNFPLISAEPKKAVFMFIEEQFYLLPILAHDEIEIDDMYEGRILQLAAATSAKNGRGATTLKDKEFAEQVAKATDAKSTKLKKLQIEIVYVIDLTNSMGPYLDATKNIIRKTVEAVGGDKELLENVHFGLWGYRDDAGIPGMEFNTKNFTPQLQTVNNFVTALDQVSVAKAGSEGYAEDVFSGMDKAMRETAWNPDAMRFIILIGDAPAHEPGHKWNASGQSAKTLRGFANDNQINVFSIHIMEPEADKFHEQTEAQFRELARNRGVSSAGGSSYSSVSSKDVVGFEKISGVLIDVFKNTVAAARKAQDVSTILVEQAAPVSDLYVSAPTPAAIKKPEKTVSDLVVTTAADSEEVKELIEQTDKSANEMVRAALVDWLGKEENVQPPRDIVAWVTDKDLTDPAIPAMEVRVLVNKNQLDSLRTVLQEIMAAGRRGQIGGEDFFTALQSTSATLSVTPEQIRMARTLGDTGLIPEFLLDLPYKSRIMSMNDDVWSSWSVDQQDEFLNDIDAKIMLYSALHDNHQGWVQLNEGDDPDEFVHPISLEMLP